MIQLYHGDALQHMATMEAASVDLVLTDVPYSEQTHVGMRSTQRGGSAISTINFASITGDDLRGYLSECGRVCKRWVITFADWKHVAGLQERPPEGLEFVRMGVWVKPNAMPQLTGDRPAQGWEAIAFLHKAGLRKRWNGGGRSSVFHCMTVRAGRFVENFHPAEKPVSLLSELIQLFTDAGDTVFDPFCGSASTIVACVNTGRNGIGVELDADYFKIAQRRVAEAEAQPRLIPDDPAPKQEAARMF